MLNKITLILFKYIPAISIMGALLNSIIYLCDSSAFDYIPYFLDGICGMSVIVLILLFLISFKFKYCTWHRILLFNSLFNVFIAIFDSLHWIEIPKTRLIILMLIVSVICCSIATIIHLKNVRQGNIMCATRHTTSNRYDLFLLGFIRWFPLIQLVGFLLSNTFALFDFDIRYCYMLDFAVGNSLLATIFVYLVSKRLYLPFWHRALIAVNFINCSIAFIDANIRIFPLSNMQLYLAYYIMPTLCIAFVIVKQINTYIYEHKTQNPT